MSGGHHSTDREIRPKNEGRDAQVRILKVKGTSLVDLQCSHGRIRVESRICSFVAWSSDTGFKSLWIHG
eukprot:gene8634-6065_t